MNVGSQIKHIKEIDLLNAFMCFNVYPLYTGGLFQYYILDKSICHFRGVRSILSLFLFLMENPVSKQCRL